MDVVDLEHARHRIATELPPRVRWLIKGTPLDFDFSRSQSPLQPLSTYGIHGTDEKDWWNTFFLFGEENYSEGGGASPVLGISSTSGEIFSFDVERESRSLLPLNSDIECFIKTFQLFDRVLRLGTTTCDLLSSSAIEIDPRAFQRSEWALLLDYVVTD
jgi:hypothetical protein